VVNKPIDITLGDLFEKVDLTLRGDGLATSPVFFGGPVQTDRGFVLHQPSEGEATTFNSTLSVPGGLSMTTSKDVLESLAAGNGPNRVLVTLGFSGWAPGQLEEEIGRNGWLTVAAEPGIIFDTPADQRYSKALSLLGIDLHMLSQEAGHA